MFRIRMDDDQGRPLWYSGVYDTAWQARQAAQEAWPQGGWMIEEC